VMAEPPLIGEFNLSGADKALSQYPATIPQGGYPAEFVARLKALGLKVNEIPAATAGALRGTLAAVTMDTKTGKRTAVNQPGVMVFSSVQ
jgi:hypothetical protein